MKTVVFYHSLTGNTKKYAEDIARMTGGTAYELKKTRKWVDIAMDADCVVFGGNVESGAIMGLNDFIVQYDYFEDKHVIIFAVGMAYPTPEGRKDLISTNLLDMYHVRFYQFQGGFDLKKLKFPRNFMMKRVLKAMGAKPDANAAELQISNFVDNPLVVYDQAKVDKVVSVINQLSLETPKA